jgi:hypothetical protein
MADGSSDLNIDLRSIEGSFAFRFIDKGPSFPSGYFAQFTLTLLPQLIMAEVLFGVVLVPEGQAERIILEAEVMIDIQDQLGDILPSRT